MTGPQLQPHQSAYLPTETERVWLAHEFDKPASWTRDAHLPTRACLGCGHTANDRWYVQCHSWGVEAWRSTGQRPDDQSPIYTELFRLSWAEVAQLQTAEGVQQELAL